MWNLYDDLIEQLPAAGHVSACLHTPVWTVATTDWGTGLAMTPLTDYKRTSLCNRMAGMEIKALAAFVKSWDAYEAAAGLATMNSFFNRSEGVAENTKAIVRSGGEDHGVFGGFDSFIQGKNVTIIGHGPYADYLPSVCNCTILERKPCAADLPDPACEFVLPKQDYVFITASALENKTMPRLLELSKNAFTVVWGPSTPLTPTLFSYGADALLGQTVCSADAVTRIAGEGGLFRDFAKHTKSVLWFADSAFAQRFMATH